MYDRFEAQIDAQAGLATGTDDLNRWGCVHRATSTSGDPGTLSPPRYAYEHPVHRWVGNRQHGLLVMHAINTPQVVSLPALLLPLMAEGLGRR